MIKTHPIGGGILINIVFFGNKNDMSDFDRISPKKNMIDICSKLSASSPRSASGMGMRMRSKTTPPKTPKTPKGRVLRFL